MTGKKVSEPLSYHRNLKWFSISALKFWKLRSPQKHPEFRSASFLILNIFSSVPCLNKSTWGPPLPLKNIHVVTCLISFLTNRLYESGWKGRYYLHKFGVSDQRDHEYFADFTSQVASEYVLGLAWVLQYYYQGTNWFNFGSRGPLSP